MTGHRSSVRRFEAKAIEPDRVVPLPDGHPALTEGRTIFMKTVTPSTESPRFLISGHSNTKLGKTVLKGPMAGYAIYQLSLEERATCPRSCQQWASCYGNSMPFARRHTPDAEFERLLIAEVMTLCRTHPEGLLVRLHVLGDFYSVEYVYIWASLLKQFPQLNVFGYTSRRIDDADPATVRIARAIKVLTDGAWERFAIRTSGDGNPERSQAVVVDEDPCAPDTIVCPAQTKATEACASCGLCWAPGARDKKIAFLRHGRKLRGPNAANDLVAIPERKPVARPAPEPRSVEARKAASEGAPLGPRAKQALDFLWNEWVRQGSNADGTLLATYKEIHIGSSVPLGSVAFAIYELEKRHLLAYEKGERGAKTTFTLAPVLRLPPHAEKPAAAPPTAVARPGPGFPPLPIKSTTTVAPRPVTREPAAPSADDLPQPSQSGVQPRSLIARKPGQCAWPTNSPPPGRGQDTTFCCAPVAGKLQYCADHAKTMFTPRRAKP